MTDQGTLEQRILAGDPMLADFEKRAYEIAELQKQLASDLRYYSYWLAEQKKAVKVVPVADRAETARAAAFDEALQFLTDNGFDPTHTVWSPAAYLTTLQVGSSIQIMRDKEQLACVWVQSLLNEPDELVARVVFAVCPYFIYKHVGPNGEISPPDRGNS